MNKKIPQDQVVESFRVRVQADQLKTFMAGVEDVETFLITLRGYVGTEILLLSDQELMVLIRWENCTLFEENMVGIITSPIIQKWMNTAELLSQQPCISKTHYLSTKKAD